VRWKVAAAWTTALLVSGGFVAAPALAGEPAAGVISEVKASVLVHDVLRDGNKTAESNTVDLGGEVLFAPFKFANPDAKILRTLVQPRLHLGGLVNTAGHTDSGYLGLTWDYRFDNQVFIEGAFGFALHNGQLHAQTPPNNYPNLGSSVLFREGIDVGYRFDGVNSVALHLSHMSHAGWFADENDGMTFLGLRYGYRFD